MGERFPTIQNMDMSERYYTVCKRYYGYYAVCERYYAMCERSYAVCKRYYTVCKRYYTMCGRYYAVDKMFPSSRTRTLPKEAVCCCTVVFSASSKTNMEGQGVLGLA